MRELFALRGKREGTKELGRWGWALGDEFSKE